MTPPYLLYREDRKTGTIKTVGQFWFYRNARRARDRILANAGTYVSGNAFYTWKIARHSHY